MQNGRQKNQQRGYILLFVLAVMMLLGALSLTVARRQRIGMQLVQNIVESTRNEWALKAALEYTKAQLDLAQQLAAANNMKDPAAGSVDIWRIGDTRQIAVGDASVTVRLRPGVAPPDFNLFTEQEITRLFVAIGASPDGAGEYAKRVLTAKPDNGFSSPDDLLGVGGIPPALLGKPSTNAKVASSDLYHLVQMGSHIKQVDLDNTPLPIIAALTGLTMDQLAPLQAMRAAGPVKKDEAIAKIGGALGGMLAAGAATLTDLSVADGNAWTEVLLIAGKNGMSNDPLVVRYGKPGDEVAADVPADASK